MILTLTGVPGAGKSTIASMIAKKLNIPWYSIGDLRGKMANEKGITIDELNTIGETQPFSDNEVDAYQKKLGREQDNFILDGRLSWHFVPQSFKIFLDVDEDEAARRIFEASKQGLRKDERSYQSAQEVNESIRARLASDQKRYKQYYDVDYLDRSNYDLVIDTTSLNPAQIINQILQSLPS
jgi:cytidylate kinase